MVNINSQQRAGSAPRPRLSPRPLEEIYRLPSHALLTPAETELVTRLTQSALAVRRSKGQWCQSAFKFDPVSASNFDPFERRVLAVALAPSELVGVAETARARVVGDRRRGS